MRRLRARSRLSITFVRDGGLGAIRPSGRSRRANEGSGGAIVAGKGKCLTCHRIQDAGSRIGPDLTDIGAIRTVEQIQTSLVDPDAEILPENRFYRVVTRDGATITGRLLNLDTFQVLMRDQKDQLRSFQKSELREHGFVAASPDAIVSIDVLRAGAADVVAYLATLKGVVAQ